MHTTVFTHHRAILIVVCGILSAGCSLIGFGVGAASDSDSPERPLATPMGLDSLSVGTDLEIVTTGHTKIEAD